MSTTLKRLVEKRDELYNEIAKITNKIAGLELAISIVQDNEKREDKLPDNYINELNKIGK